MGGRRISMAKLVLGKNKTIVVPAIVKTVGGITPSGTINITSNGVHDVTNYASASVSVASGAPVINSLNVTPTTSAQTITPGSGVDGFAPVNVAAVTSSIDANIVAGNIKNGVEILGVTGTYGGSVPDYPYRTLEINNNILYPSRVGSAVSNIKTNGVPYTQINSFALAGANLSAALTENQDFSSVIYVGKFGCAGLFQQAYIEGDIDFSGLNSQSATSEGAFIDAFNGSTISGDIDFSNLPQISTSAIGKTFYRAFSYANVDGNIDFSNLTTVSGESCFDEAFFSLQGTVKLTSLATVSARYGFREAFGRSSSTGNYPQIQGLFNTLTKISGDAAFYGAFRYRADLTNITFSALNEVTGAGVFWSAFYNCTNLLNINFPSLTASSFGFYTTEQFVNMLQGMTGCRVHFPSNLETTIQSLTGYPSFGGTNTTLLFDLPATS